MVYLKLMNNEEMHRGVSRGVGEPTGRLGFWEEAVHLQSEANGTELEQPQKEVLSSSVRRNDGEAAGKI